jgi:hypothetical protein
MQVRVFRWLDREFVEISAESRFGVAADQGIIELFQRFDDELRLHGLSLNNCVRVRIWGRDKAARTVATAARSKVLTGHSKAASSSFISSQWLDSDAVAGLELLAMKPLHSNAEDIRQSSNRRAIISAVCAMIRWRSIRATRQKPIH